MPRKFASFPGVVSTYPDQYWASSPHYSHDVLEHGDAFCGGKASDLGRKTVDREAINSFSPGMFDKDAYCMQI
jgi:hypothetical protein